MPDDDAQVRAAPDAPVKPAQNERDFGDSAGYGSGGSTMDYHEVGDKAADGVKDRRNPLDAVVKIKNPVAP
jgi:hypothetical protein